MEHSVKYDSEKHVVITNATGPLSSENIREMARVSRVEAEKYICYNLLVNITECSISRSMLDAFMDMQYFMEISGLSVNYKCAILYDPVTYPEDRAKFIETVVTNRPNPRFKMVMSYEEAFHWLNQ